MPLVAWIYADKFRQELEGRRSAIYSHWAPLGCADPSPVKGRPMVEVRAAQLDCDERERRRLQKQFLGTTPLKIRIIEKFRKRRQDSIKIVWFVQSRVDDIAGFQLLLRKAAATSQQQQQQEQQESTYLVNETIIYTKRDHVISALPLDVKYTLCIFPIDSRRRTQDNFREYCVTFANGQTDIVFDDDDDARGDEVGTAAATTNNRKHHRLSSAAAADPIHRLSSMLLFLLFGFLLLLL